MRIAHITSGLSRSAAGVGETVQHLSALQAQGGAHEVAVFGLMERSWQEDAKHWRGARSVPIEFYGPRSIGYAPQLLGALTNFEPDIVHLHGLWMHQGISVRQWHRRTRRPYVLSTHGMLSPVALSFSSLQKRVAALLYQTAVLRDAAALVATTVVEAGDLRSYGLLNPVAVVPHGVEIVSAPLPVSEQPTRRILSLGRLHPQKGLDQLLRAWALLEADFPSWSLDLAGPSEEGEMERLQALTSHLNLKRVRIDGPVYGQEKTARMAGAAIFVLPSRGENFGLTVAESLALGVPVISSRGAPWSGLDDEACGRWVDHGVAPMVEALKELMQLEPSDLFEMGKRGRRWMEREFSWKKIAAEMNEVYTWVVNRGTCPSSVSHL